MEKERECRKGKSVATEEDNSNNQKLQNFDVIIKQLACSNPSILSYKEEIKQKLCKLPLSHTPDHPTYAAMIERAIMELNEEEGSREEAISKFIEAKYQDLPPAHVSFLSHHLEVLVKKGDIVSTPENCYRLQDENIDSSTELKHGQKRLREKQDRQQHEVEGGQSQEQHNLVTEVENQTHNEENGAQEHQPDEFEDQHQSQEEQIEISKKQKLELTNGQFYTEELQIEVIEKQTQVHGQPVEGVVDDKQEADKSLAHEKGPEVSDENNQAHGKGLEEIECQNQAEEQHVEAIGTQTQVHGQPIQGVVDDQKQADESLAHEKEPEVSEENNQAQGKELEGIEYQNQAEEHLEAIEKQKEVRLVELIEELNDGNEKDQQLAELTEPQRQVLKQKIEVLAEEQNQAEKKSEMTEEEPQGGVEDEVIEEECDKGEQKSEATEEKNQPQDKSVEVIAEPVQSQAMQIMVIEAQAKRQEQQNELTEEQKRLGEQQMEVCCKIMDLRNIMDQFTKKQEENEATVTTPSSSLTCQKSDHFGSLLLSKKECIELLRKSNKIQGQLIEIVSSLTVMEAPEHNTFHPMRGEERKKNLEESLLMKGPFNGKDCMHPNLKRPPEAEVTTLEEFYQKQRKQAKLCGQQVTPKSQPKSMGIAPDVCTNPSLEEAQQRVFEDLDGIVDFNSTTESNNNIQGEAAMPVEAMKKTYLNAPMELKDNDLEQLIVEQLSQEQQHFDGVKKPDCKVAITVDQEQQPENSIQERSREHELTAMNQPCQTQQQRQGQQQKKRQLRPRGPRTADMIDLGVPLASLKSKLKQKAESPICNGPQQQTRGSGQGSITRTRAAAATVLEGPYQPQSAVDETMTEQYEQQKQGRGRPRKSNSDLNNAEEESFPLDDQHLHEQQQPLSRGRGRPPKIKPGTGTTMDALSSPELMDQREEKQVQLRGQGRCRKSKRFSDMQQGLGRPCESNSDFNNAGGESFLLDDQHHHEQQQSPGHGRGRPPKIKPDTGTTMDALLPPQHMLQQEETQVQGRGRGRRPKLKQPTDTTEDSLLPLQHPCPQLEQHPQGQGNGRPTKSNQGTVTVADTLLPSQHQQQQTQSSGQGRVTRARARAATAIDPSLKQQL